MENTLTIESDTRNLNIVEPFLASAVSGRQMDEMRYHNAVIALTEAVNNAIVHGNKRDSAKRVHIAANIENGNLILGVRDEGCGFDIDSLPDPLHPDNLLREGGRGIFLIRALTDSSEFYSSENGSTILMRIALNNP